MILLKDPMNASTRLSMNGKSPRFQPLVRSFLRLAQDRLSLRLSKDERRVFQQNRKMEPGEAFESETIDPNSPLYYEVDDLLVYSHKR